MQGYMSLLQLLQKGGYNEHQHPKWSQFNKYYQNTRKEHSWSTAKPDLPGDGVNLII